MVDAYVLREMHRRCNYDGATMEHVAAVIEMELIERSLGYPRDGLCLDDKVSYYRDQYTRSSLASAVILPYLDSENVQCLTKKHLEALAVIVNGMLEHKSFELVTVHDEFKSLCGNVNQVRWHYKEILAEVADSNVLDDLMSQLHGAPGVFPKINYQLGDLIRGSNYGLC